MALSLSRSSLFFLPLYLLLLLQELQFSKTQTGDDRAEKRVPAANVILITLFALAVVIYGDTLWMSSRSLFEIFSQLSRNNIEERTWKSNQIKFWVGLLLIIMSIMVWGEVNMEGQMSPVRNNTGMSHVSSPSIEGLIPINQANKRQTVAGCCEKQGERKHWLSADSESLCMAGDQAQMLIVILEHWGYVYAIINLGTCLFARD